MDGCDSINSDTSCDSLDIGDNGSYCSYDSVISDTYSQDMTISDFSDYSSTDEDEVENHSQIEVIDNFRQLAQSRRTAPPVWFEEYIPRPANLPCIRQTIRRDNKYEKCGMLPSISVPNARSIFPKARNFIQDMRMRDLSLVIMSETWQRETKRKHKNEIERMLFMEGLKFISTTRPGGRRGGGCGIIGDLTHYTLDKIEVPNPDKVEMCWGILRPKQSKNWELKKYLIGSFYCPPNSRKKEKLITHIIKNTHILMTKYPKGGIFIGGYKNSLNITPILLGLPKCRQVVTENTHNNKCLDILITNIHTLYQPVVISPPLQPDDPAKSKPSDHLVPILYPISGQSVSVSRTYQTKTTRPMPESGMRKFGEWLTQEEWAQVAQADGPDEKLEQLTNICTQKINHIFPDKKVKITNQDLPFITWKLKEMKRKLKRLYRAEGRKQKYLIALSEYETEFQKTST